MVSLPWELFEKEGQLKGKSWIACACSYSSATRYMYIYNSCSILAVKIWRCKVHLHLSFLKAFLTPDKRGCDAMRCKVRCTRALQCVSCSSSILQEGLVRGIRSNRSVSSGRRTPAAWPWPSCRRTPRRRATRRSHAGRERARALVVTLQFGDSDAAAPGISAVKFWLDIVCCCSRSKFAQDILFYVDTFQRSPGCFAPKPALTAACSGTSRRRPR